MKVVLRAFNPDTDSGLVYDSYPKGVFYSANKPIDRDKVSWMNAFYKDLPKRLQEATVRIACMDEDPNEIFGYSIVSGETLDFVYVKQSFRNKGIATLLTKNKFSKINESTLTKAGAAILRKHPELIKGEPNVERETLKE